MLFRDSQDLPPETLEIFKGIVGRVDYDETEVDDVMLGAFACGISTPEQEQITLAALIRNRQLRERLREMEMELSQMRSTPFSQILEKGSQSILAHCMRGAMQASMRFYTRARQISVRRGWAEISSARDIEAKSMRALFGSIGESIQHSLTLSHRPDELILNEPAGHCQDGITLRAEINTDGCLVVNGTTSELLLNSLEWKSNLQHLQLSDPNGGSIPICGIPTQQTWQVIAEDFGEITGFEPTNLPASWFTIGPPNGEFSRQAGFNLVAHVEGSNESLELMLVDLPRIEREHFVITLRAGAEALPILRQMRLNLLAPVGKLIQSIGSYSNLDWSDQEVTFRCPLGGVIDGTVECGSILHVRLEKDSGPTNT